MTDFYDEARERLLALDDAPRGRWVGTTRYADETTVPDKPEEGVNA